MALMLEDVLEAVPRPLELDRAADIALVNEEPTDDSLPMPSELDWKRERRRRR